MRSQERGSGKCRVALAVSVAVSALAVGSAAAAEETPETSAAVADTGASEQLDTVTVTAERREISLQQAPLSVSAVTSDTLKASNISDITGLNGTVPGLVVARSGGGERILSIRGIGSETPENTNTQPGVSCHIDGVYIFNSIAASAAFIDVQQVEVLRGPQGTLFGQGSTGGTINVVSKQPELDDFGGQVKVGAGNYGLSKSSASINLPAGDTFAVRVAAQE
ncbi:MAG: TonB-dependent receptor [Nitrospira sp.]